MEWSIYHSEKDPYLVVDGAHNPDAARKLQESLRMYFPNREFVFLMGVFRDKQYETIAERMALDGKGDHCDGNPG